MPDKAAKSKKRKKQYEDFISMLMKEEECINLREAGKDLKKLWEGVESYMDPENPVEIDRKKLLGFVNEYVRIADNLTRDIPEKDMEQVSKLRKIMAKDIRMINIALGDKEKEKYNLQQIFDNSRSILVQVDPQKVDKKSGAQNSRMHIQVGTGEDKIDGFFTVHNKPYDPKQEKLEIIKKVAGDDRDYQAFVAFLFSKDRNAKGAYYSYFMRQAMDDFKKHNEMDLGLKNVGSDATRCLYYNDDTYKLTYEKSINKDLEKYLKGYNIPENSPKYNKLVKFCAQLRKDKNLNKLVDAVNEMELANNKENIIRGNKINAAARIDKRNSAMSAVADLFGVGYVIADSKNMRVRIGDEELKGTFMKKADGLDPKNMDQVKDLLPVSPKSIDSSPGLINDLANLQILDYICGNTDRHINNMVFKTKTVKENGKEVTIITGVQGIDNDTCLGGNLFELNPIIMKFVDLKDIHIIPRKTAEQLMALKPEMLKTVLAGYDLKDNEIEGAVNRLEAVKEAITLAWAVDEFESNNTIKKNSKYPLLKIVDEDDMKDISIIKQLYDDKGHYESPLKTMKVIGNKVEQKENYNTYTLLMMAAQQGTVYANKCEESFSKLMKHNSALRDNVKTAQKSMLNLEKESKYANKKTTEYEEMITAVNELKTAITQGSVAFSPSKIHIINNAFLSIHNSASKAVEKTTDYYLMLQEKIDTAKAKGKKIPEEQLKYVQSIRDCLDDIEEIYSGVSKYLNESTKYEETYRNGIQHSKEAVKEKTELLKAPQKPETPDSMEKIERILETDKRLCANNKEFVINGGDTNNTVARVTMAHIIDINSREKYLKMLKEDVSEEQKQSYCEEIAVNHILRRCFVNNEAKSKEYLKNQGMLDETGSALKEMMKDDPGLKEAAEKIKDNLEILKNPSDAEKIKTANLIMKNGIGTLKMEDDMWVNYLKISEEKAKKVDDIFDKIHKKFEEKRMNNEKLKGTEKIKSPQI